MALGKKPEEANGEGKLLPDRSKPDRTLEVPSLL